MNLNCGLCFHNCALDEGQTGFCRARANRGGEIVCVNYGRLTAIALDPIEKKPLRHFYPGSMVLSVGSFGCNMRCPFCQNHEISMAGEGLRTEYVPPEALAEYAEELRHKGNIGVAYTYNEPLIGYEYVRDCAKIVRERGMKNVIVTNGMIAGKPWRGLLPFIDAVNIDLKGFSPQWYSRLGGDFETAKRSIAAAAEYCHVEVTTLVVPGGSDDIAAMRGLARWLASVNEEIPLHVTRFFPRHRMAGGEPTPVETVRAHADAVREYLRHVYVGNC